MADLPLSYPSYFEFTTKPETFKGLARKQPNTSAKVARKYRNLHLLRPLGEYIEHLYVKRFKKEGPEQVTSLEEQAQAMQRKKAEKKARKQARQASGSNTETSIVIFK